MTYNQKTLAMAAGLAVIVCAVLVAENYPQEDPVLTKAVNECAARTRAEFKNPKVVEELFGNADDLCRKELTAWYAIAKATKAMEVK